MSQIQKKAFFSTIKDGTNEIFEAILLFIAGLMFVHIYAPFIGCIIILIFGFQWSKISQNIKKKHVYPRIGVVELRADHKYRMRKYKISFAISVTLSIIIFFILVFIQDFTIDATFVFLPIIVGGALFGRSLYFYFFSGKSNYILFGVTALIFAVISIFLPFPQGSYHPLVYTWTESFVLAVIGGSKLHRFIKQNPVVGESTEI